MAKVTVYSVNPISLQLYSGPHGTFRIDGAKETNVAPFVIPAAFVIPRMRAPLDNGLGTQPQLLDVDPLLFAQSAIERHEGRGLFIVEGDRRPSAEEVSAARASLRARNIGLVRQGDSLNQEGRSRHITTEMRQAALSLGERRAWADGDAYAAKEPCPACSTLITPGVAVCPTCRAVLDPEKAAKFGLAPAPAQKPAKQPTL